MNFKLCKQTIKKERAILKIKSRDLIFKKKTLILNNSNKTINFGQFFLNSEPDDDNLIK